MSWLVRADVEAGRDELNFSNSMPSTQYTLLRPDAALSAEEQQEVIDALRAMDG